MKIETIENVPDFRRTYKNIFRNVLPFIPGLKLWISKYKECERRNICDEHKIKANVNNKAMRLESFQMMSTYFENKIQIIHDEDDKKELINPFKKFSIQAKFILEIDEKNEVNKLTNNSKEDKIKKVNISEKNFKILQNKNREKKYEEILESSFEKRLKEISNKELTQKQNEDNPFLNFKLDYSALKSVFSY